MTDKPVETATEHDKMRPLPLRTFRVTSTSPLDGEPFTEYVTAHNMSFHHPREVVFVDISVQDNMVLQYTRKAVYDWLDVTETTAGAGSAAVN